MATLPRALEIPIAQILVGERARTTYNEQALENLAESIDRHGLIHPITIDADYNLIAGGRRLAAHIKLGRETIVAYLRETLPDNVRAEMEIDENVKREPFTWQERVAGIVKIHKRKAAEEDDWTRAATGDLLGVDSSWVGKLIHVQNEIDAGNQKVINASNINEAISKMLEKKEEIARAKERERAKHVQLAKAKRLAAAETVPDSSPGVKPADKKLPRISINLPRFFLHGDAFRGKDAVLKKVGAISVDHVITDIPYGINMVNLPIKGIETVEAQHDVDDNIKLFRPFLKESFRVLKDGGYCVFFYDVTHHEKLIKIATEVGFRPQMWPLIWCKSSSNKNMASAQNFTKATEYVMVLRKGNASLAKKQSRNYLEAGKGEIDKYDNPFSKPFEVWRWLIEAVSHEGQTILDPFAGEMSCPLACIELNRQPLAVEIELHHFERGLEHVKETYRKHYSGLCDFIEHDPTV